MHPDLERLIRLQALENELQQLRQVVDTEADRRAAVEARVEAQRAELARVRERLTENQHARREVEKDLAQVQTRLSRYKDQLMGVKTNKEYHAMQTEIGMAEAEVRRFEDRILESMVEADDVSAAVKQAQEQLATAEADARAAIERLGKETAAARDRLATATVSRDDVARSLPADLLFTFQTIASHRGGAVVPTTPDGICSVCHVRIRPKAFQDIRRNDAVHRCDSCQRILYYAPPAAPPAAAPQSPRA